LLSSLLLICSCGEKHESVNKNPFGETVEKDYSGDLNVAKKYVNPAGDQFPVLGWFSLWGSGLTYEKYKEMADAGFNLSYSQLANVSECEQALSAAKGSGVKIIARFKDEMDFLERNVKKLRTSPTLAGYFICDEPAASEFKTLRSQIDIVRKNDDTHFIYVNLFPNYVASSALVDGDYGKYIQAAIDEMRLGYVSFDFYPVTKDSDGNQTVADRQKGFFSNLEVVRDVCKQNGVPFWAFALTTSHAVYPKPTLSALKYQIYHDLAYGAQGIQYFTYVLVPGGSFYEGPLTFDPFVRTDIYSLVKKVNTVVHALTPYFLGCDVVAVGSTGDTLPSWRCKKFADVKPSNVISVTSSGVGLTASYFTKDGKDYLFLVNQDINNAQGVTVEFATNAKSISEENVLKVIGTSDAATIEPGGMLLYQF